MYRQINGPIINIQFKAMAAAAAKERKVVVRIKIKFFTAAFILELIVLIIWVELVFN
jgi:hypothetical protein